jgi:DME family drug/metabolite transporter
LDLGLGATTAAYALFGFGLARLTVPTVVTLTLAEPATAALLSVLVLSQRLAPVGWLGVALVIVGVAFVATARDEPAVQPIR